MAPPNLGPRGSILARVHNTAESVMEKRYESTGRLLTPLSSYFPRPTANISQATQVHLVRL